MKFGKTMATALVVASVVGAHGDPEDVTFFDPVEILGPGGAGQPRSLATRSVDAPLADFNGDRRLDFLFQDFVSVGLALGNGVGGTRETRVTRTFFDDSRTLLYAAAMRVLDLDDDGDLDVVAVVPGRAQSLWRLSNDGAGNFTVTRLDLPSTATGLLSHGPIGPVAADSLFVGTIDHGVLRFELDGLGGLTRTDTVDDDVWHDALLVDMNGDGLRELVLVSGRRARVVLGTLDGLGPAGEEQAITYTIEPLAADFDGDGRDELLLHDGIFALVEDGSLVLEHTIDFPGNTLALAVVDIDHDGHLDVARIDSAPGDVRIHRNDGTGSLVPGQWIDMPYPAEPSAGRHYAIAVGDVDLDGLSDLCVVGSADTGVLVRRSGGPPPAVESVSPGVLLEAGAVRLGVDGVRFEEGASIAIEGARVDSALVFESEDSLVVNAQIPSGIGGGTRRLTVRNPDGQVGEATVTLHSLELSQRRGKLRQVVEPSRDVLEISGRVEQTTLSADSDVAALIRDGTTLLLGDPADPLAIVIEPEDPRWTAPRRPDRGRYVFRTEPDQFPRVKLRIDVRSRRFTLRVSHYDHPGGDPGAVQVRWSSGPDLGRIEHRWVPNRKGTRFRFRR